MKTGIIIQARMGSTRLSGKVLKKIGDKTVLGHVIERVRQSNTDEIIIATTVLEQDNLIEKEAMKYGVKVFRGSEEDVLSRYYLAAKENKLDTIIRITSDCPLIDPNIIKAMCTYYNSNKVSMVTNAGSDMEKRTFPRGLDTEIFSFGLLEEAHNMAKEKYQREHVTPYIYEKISSVYYFKNDVDYSQHRWTLDTEDDFKLISRIYKALYNGVHDFYLEDIIRLFNEELDLLNINAHIEQKIK